EAKLEELTRILAVQSVPAGTLIAEEGSAGDTMFFIAQGDVRIEKRVETGGAKEVALLSPGDTFGEMALIEGSTRAARAVAHTDVTLVVLGKDALDRPIGELLARRRVVLPRPLREGRDASRLPRGPERDGDERARAPGVRSHADGGRPPPGLRPPEHQARQRREAPGASREPADVRPGLPSLIAEASRCCLSPCCASHARALQALSARRTAHTPAVRCR